MDSNDVILDDGLPVQVGFKRHSCGLQGEQKPRIETLAALNNGAYDNYPEFKKIVQRNIFGNPEVMKNQHTL